MSRRYRAGSGQNRHTSAVATTAHTATTIAAPARLTGRAVLNAGRTATRNWHEGAFSRCFEALISVYTKSIYPEVAGNDSMQAMAVVRETGQAERRAETRLDARWPGQCQMIRAAQIVFGGSVWDCALLDTSRGGARVHLLAPADLPEIATLRLPGGECWTVQRRWTRGSEVGFKILGEPIPAP